jgi:hypothetical protein
MSIIEEYLETYENYKSGNYDYETIHDPEGVLEAVKNGKKLVLGIREGGKFFIFMILLITLFVITISAFERNIVLMLILAASLLIIPSLIIVLFERFFVFGLEGFVYKRRGHRVKFIDWKDVVKINTLESEISKSRFSNFFPKEIDTTYIHLYEKRIVINPMSFKLNEFKSGNIKITRSDLAVIMIQKFREWKIDRANLMES